MTVALIEDAFAIADFLMTALKAHGYQVHHFSQGISFLASLENNAYDIVLTNFNIPGEVSGLQVITHLQEQYPALPIIVISGTDENTIARLQARYPGLGILRKPFKLRDLLQEMMRMGKFPE